MPQKEMSGTCEYFIIDKERIGLDNLPEDTTVEPPRLFRRVDYLSPATVTGPFSLW